MFHWLLLIPNFPKPSSVFQKQFLDFLNSIQALNLISGLELWKWATRDYITHLGHRISLFGSALCFAGWIAQSKDNWTLIAARHFLQNLVRESTSHCCNTCHATTIIRVTAIIIIMMRQLNTTVGHHHHTVRTCFVPRTHNSFGGQCFSAAGPRVCNSLPPHLQDKT